MIQLSSRYNQSCDQCLTDRYLLCRNNSCQCPPDTFWNGAGQCLNQLYVDSPTTCQNNNWCRRDRNLTCVLCACRCPLHTFWNSQTCENQLLAGMPCNTSEQCRIDHNLTCSSTNRTCQVASIVAMTVINGTVPAIFSNISVTLDRLGEEWWRAFNGDTSDRWNSMRSYVTDYLLITFDSAYFLASLQLTVCGDGVHDPETISIYLDENATCLIQSFSFAQKSSQFTFPSQLFNGTILSIPIRKLLIGIDRWSPYQGYVNELTFFGRRN